MTDTRDWFLPLAEDGGLRMFAFPHAGAGCAQLAPFARALSARGVSVWAANLPGRQARLDEPARAEFADLVGDLVDAITPALDRPYALFGYCGGALLAFGLARALHARALPLPERLVVAAYEAPDIALRPRGLAHLPSELLWTYLTESGGVPVTLSGDARLRTVAEPAARADFALLAAYRHQPDLPLPLPITVCHGRADGSPRGAFLGWRRQTTYPLDVRVMDGGHWLLDDAGDELAAGVAEALALAAPGPGGPR